MDSESSWARDRARFVEDAHSAWEEHREPLPDHGYRLGPLAMQFATLTYALLDANTVGEVFDQIVETAPRVLPGADVVSLSVREADGVLRDRKSVV